MTAVAADGFSSDLAQIQARAARVRFLPVLGTCLLWPLAALFTLVGWAFGSLWYTVVLAALTLQYGFCKGARIELKARHPEPPRQPSPLA